MRRVRRTSRPAAVPPFEAAAYASFSMPDDDGFWRDELRQTASAPPLYGARRRRRGTPFRTVHRFGIQRTRAIDAFVARHAGAARANRTLLATLLAMFAVYQQRVSRVDRLTIGVAYHNRDRRFGTPLDCSSRCCR